MFSWRMAAESAAAGVVLTLLSGLAPSTPFMLVGASWYGLPVSWLYKLVIAPQYFPWRANYLNLVIDIIFWAVVVAIIMMVVHHLNKKPAQKKRSKR